jgi:hypothetical protein
MLLDRALTMFPMQPCLCFTTEMEEDAGGGNSLFSFCGVSHIIDNFAINSDTAILDLCAMMMTTSDA